MGPYSEIEQLLIAEKFCNFIQSHYVCHEYYYHSNGNHNWLHIVVNDFGDRTEIKIDLNARHNKHLTNI